MRLNNVDEEIGMIHVWYSNQLEKLADRLIANLDERREGFPSQAFAQTRLVVPNRNQESYLRFEIARSTGIAANLEFVFLEKFLASLIPPGRSEVRVLERGKLQSMLLKLFDSADTLPPEVRDYLAASSGAADAVDLRRFQLASRLARLFEDYVFSRPEMLRAWKNGAVLLSPEPWAKTARWQSELWRLLFAADGLRERIFHDTGVRWLRLAEMFEAFSLQELALPSHVHLFGFSYVSRGHHELLELLARRSEVHVYCFMPLIEFREDCTFPLGKPQIALASKNDRDESNGFLEQTEPQHLESNEAPRDSLAVRSWGRPGRENLHLLNQIKGVELHDAYEFDDNADRSLLGRLRRDILLRCPEGAAGPRLNEVDSSIQILACQGIRREVEVLANEIWAMVRQDDERTGVAGDRLRFKDIAVVLADSKQRETYQTHLRAVFAETHHLPFNIIDVSVSAASRVVEALQLLLSLPLGNFERPDLLNLLTHPILLQRFPDADAREWATWCESTTIVHGADRGDHEGLYIEKDLYNWDQGVRRLVLGAFMTGARAGEDRAFVHGDMEYRPEEYPPDSLANAALFCLLTRSLLADARFARGEHLSLSAWAEFLAREVNAYLAAESDEEEHALALCLRAIHGLRDLDLDGRKVSYRIAHEFVREALAGIVVGQGQYLADGVVVSSFLPMRALPFRVVFICGLGEGRFPAAVGDDSLDLRFAERQVGDVSPRERDKYLFLETLASTRDRLCLSYVARASATGEELLPSTLIQELITLLKRDYLTALAAKDMVRSHPLRRYDEKYFPSLPEPSDEPAFPNYLLEARREAGAQALRKSMGRRDALAHEELRLLPERLQASLGLCPIPDLSAFADGPETLEISISSLRRFLECPLQGWGRVILGMREEEGDKIDRIDENFATPRLAQVMLLRDAFWRAVQSTPPDFAKAYDDLAAGYELLGTTPTGIFQHCERKRHLSALTRWHENVSRWQLQGPFSPLRFGRAEENLKVDALARPLLLNVATTNGTTAPRFRRVALYGATEILSNDHRASVTLIDREKSSDKDFLRGFLDAMVLALAEENVGADHLAYVAASKAKTPAKGKDLRTFGPFSPEAARDYLETLLLDLLSGPHDYLLPCEAVFDAHARGEPIAACVAKLKEDPYTSVSSSYGPVPHPLDYEPPEESDAQAMVQRRFGPFFAALPASDA